MYFVVALSLLFLVNAIHGQVIMETVNNTCTVSNADVGKTVYQSLPNFLAVYETNVLAATSMYNSGMFDFTANPLAASSVLRAYLFSVYKATGIFLEVGLQNGFYAGYRINTANGLYFNYCPAGSSTRGSYPVDATTGLITGSTFANATYVVTGRYWYTYAASTTGATYGWSPMGYSASSSSVITCCVQRVNVPSTNTMFGVWSMDFYVQIASNVPITVPSLSQFLVNLNNQPSSVIFIYETVGGNLLANTVGESITPGLLANASTNDYIKQSTLYISKNKISAYTSQYSAALGYSITPRFYTGSNSIAWTVVVADYANTVASQSIVAMYPYSSDDDDNDNIESILGIVAATLAVLVIGFFVLAVLLVKKNAPPMSSSSSDNNKL